MKRTFPRRSIAVAALAVALIITLAGCMSDGQTAVQNEMNADRRAQGLRSLPTHPMLNAKAQAWAEKLARDGKLSHSSLSAGVPSCWRSLGENVGYGGSAASVQDAYMRSTDHRDNILDRRWGYVGVGFAKAGNRTYTVQVFMQGC
ncbi:MAG TPA: CAP domain-containing protein [Iamia sp.]|nr:CAP domain-containing protein [Iamia sp.]